MRFALDLYSNRMGGCSWPFFQRPRIIKFLNSKIRRDVSTYPNFFRILWWKIDWTLEWGWELKPVPTVVTDSTSKSSRSGVMSSSWKRVARAFTKKSSNTASMPAKKNGENCSAGKDRICAE